jgi:hypothetical protein
MSAPVNIDGAISIKEFCKRNGVGVTSAYAEIADGKLIARKCRGRTLIALDDEREWRANLPKMKAAVAAEAP